MAYSEGQLNGAQDYRVGIDVWYSGVQDWGANTSRFDWNVRIIGTYGSWSNATQYWSANIGGVGYSGTFTLPQGWGSPRIVGAGSTWHGHDGNGYRGGFPSSAYIDTNHSNIGDGGSGDAWVDAPRIPKRPSQPTPLGLDEITPTSIRYRFSGNDDGGSPIREWQIGYGTNPAVPSSFVGSGGTSVVGGLTPATDWHFWSRGRNDIGWGDWSARLSARTLASAYVGKGGSFPAAAAVNVGKGGAFVLAADVRVGKGGSFIIPG